MRLLYVLSSVDPRGGGVVEAVRSLGLAQAALGHQVEVVSLDDPRADYVRTFALPLHALGPARGSYAYRRDFPARLRELARGFDAVIVNGLWQFSTLGTWLSLRREPVPYYVFPHGMLDPWLRGDRLKFLKKWLYWVFLERRVLRDAVAVLFTCEEERRLAPQSFPFYRVRAEVAGLGCPEPPLDPPRQKELFFARWPELRGRRIFLFLGRLHPKKGCELLMEAFAQVFDSIKPGNAAPPVLLFAGPAADETYQRKLEVFAALCPPGTVHFVGMLSGDLKWGAFQAADVFVLPSHQENFGLAVVEALACGVPVLISRPVNIWREIDEDAAGYVESDDLIGTVRLLRRWEETPDATRAAMRAAARQSFARRFEIRAAAETVLRLVRGGKQ
jgi:glycosyltransferase involved in cell wall biosynthesis